MQARDAIFKGDTPCLVASRTSDAGKVGDPAHGAMSAG
jgi:hypothetical protein